MYSSKKFRRAGYDDGDARYPLLFIAEGDQWREKGLLVNALDNLLAGGATPLIAVFVPRSGTWWREGAVSFSATRSRLAVFVGVVSCC